jgi:hypothetical protein
VGVRVPLLARNFYREGRKARVPAAPTIARAVGMIRSAPGLPVAARTPVEMAISAPQIPRPGSLFLRGGPLLTTRVHLHLSLNRVTLWKAQRFPLVRRERPWDGLLGLPPVG